MVWKMRIAAAIVVVLVIIMMTMELAKALDVMAWLAITLLGCWVAWMQWKARQPPAPTGEPLS